MRFWIGETVRVRVDFTDDAGLPMAVTGVEIQARGPGGIRLTGSVNALSDTGAFYADFPLTIAGTWYFRAECDGPTQSAVEDSVDVIPSNVV